MHEPVAFETPENIEVRYRLAGLGTRFIAWFVDQIFVGILIILSVILLAIVANSLGAVLDEIFDVSDATPEQIGTYFVGIFLLIYGLGSFAYFSMMELWLRGQTLGKRWLGIRVVKADGFALDGVSILIRNLFRVIDNVPLLWIIPIASSRSQRAGDMVGGTLVVSDSAPELTEVRVQLSDRTALEAEFRFDAGKLGRLQESDFEVVERLLDRWHELPDQQRETLSQRLVDSLVAKLQVPPPEPQQRARFLEDLLAAELRRQSRLLG